MRISDWSSDVCSADLIAASTAAREADWRFTRPGALVSPRKVGEDCLADQFRDLGDYGVSEGLEAKFVHPTPKPIIHSANVRKELWPRGFPAIMANLTGKPSVLWWNCEGGAVILTASFTVIVGRIGIGQIHFRTWARYC